MIFKAGTIGVILFASIITLSFDITPSVSETIVKNEVDIKLAKIELEAQKEALLKSLTKDTVNAITAR
jgi:hypothetical protein